MTTFQDQPLHSRRAVRQNERDQAQPDASASADPAASQPEAPAEPLTYATQSRPPVPEYDGPSFRVRSAPAADAQATPTEADGAVAAAPEGGYRPRDFSPEGRRASTPTWAPQYGGVGDDGVLEHQTQGRVPVQPVAPAASPEAPVASAPVETGSLAASLGAPTSPTPAAPAASEPAAAYLSPIADDDLGPLEHTLTRRELRALRDAHRLRTASTPLVDPSGAMAPSAAQTTRLDSAVAEFDALAQAREAAYEESLPAPRGRRAAFVLADTPSEPEQAPDAVAASPADVAPAEPVAPTEAAAPTEPDTFDENAAFADPALYAPAEGVAPAAPAAPIPLVEPPVFGYDAAQFAAPAVEFAPPAAEVPAPEAEVPQAEATQAEVPQAEAPVAEPEVEPVVAPAYVVVESAPEPVAEAPVAVEAAIEPEPEPAAQEEPAAESPLSAFESLFIPSPPADVQPVVEAAPVDDVVAAPEVEQPVWGVHPAYQQPQVPQPEAAQPVAETVYAEPLAAEPAHAELAPEAPADEIIVDAEIVPEAVQPEVVQAQIIPVETTVTEVDLDASAPATGHWSTQAELEDETQHGSATLAGGVGIGSAPLTTSALVLPAIPDEFGPHDGEVLVTGSISLPESFSATGAHPAQLDESDLDHMLDPGDHQVASTDSQPVRAIRAVSTHTSSRNLISTTKPKGNRALTVLIVAASAMAAVVITLLVVGLASGQL